MSPVCAELTRCLQHGGLRSNLAGECRDHRRTEFRDGIRRCVVREPHVEPLRALAGQRTEVLHQPISEIGRYVDDFGYLMRLNPAKEQRDGMPEVALPGLGRAHDAEVRQGGSASRRPWRGIVRRRVRRRRSPARRSPDVGGAPSRPPAAAPRTSWTRRSGRTRGTAPTRTSPSAATEPSQGRPRGRSRRARASTATRRDLHRRIPHWHRAFRVAKAPTR